jgi:hypothetical protein
MPLSHTLTEKDRIDWKTRQEKNKVDNHPLRDTLKESLFDVMLSDEADLTKHGFISEETLKLLGE